MATPDTPKYHKLSRKVLESYQEQVSDMNNLCDLFKSINSSLKCKNLAKKISSYIALIVASLISRMQSRMHKKAFIETHFFD